MEKYQLIIQRAPSGNPQEELAKAQAVLSYFSTKQQKKAHFVTKASKDT